MSAARIVLKVGGSLFDWPELVEKLRDLPQRFPDSNLLLVPGGGRLADVIRDHDAIHRLGDERSHWLALKTLEIQAEILASMLPDWRMINDLSEFPAESKAILNPYSFARWDEATADRLPHSWEVTSDSIALRLAQALDAAKLILLKSTDRPEGIDWREASQMGLVDPYFPLLWERDRVEVEWWNFRNRPSSR